MAKRNVILLRGEPHEESGIATPYAVTPGMLVEPTEVDGKRAFQPHSTPGGAAAALFVREQHENTHAGAGGIDSEIAEGDECTVLYASKGDKINALTVETIERGDFVQSAGDGTVTPFDSGAIIGQADAASDLTGDFGRVQITVV